MAVKSSYINCSKDNTTQRWAKGSSLELRDSLVDALWDNLDTDEKRPCRWQHRHGRYHTEPVYFSTQ